MSHRIVRNRTLARLIVLVPVLVAACDRDPQSDIRRIGGGLQEVVHPVPGGLLSSHPGEAVVREVALGAVDLPAWLMPLGEFDETAAIGMSEGPDELVFGTLVDAEIDEDGKVLLLDSDYALVRVLDADLAPVQTFGAEGEGPGEFQQPASLLPHGPEEVAVLDRGGMRLEVLRKRDGSYEVAGRTTFAFFPSMTDACSTNGKRYVKGVQVMIDGTPATMQEMGEVEATERTIDSRMLHAVGSDGKATRSFSAPYDATYPYDGDVEERVLLMYLSVNFGPLQCDRGRIWAAYGTLGEVHAFDANEELDWIVRISDFDHPGYRFQWSDTGQHEPRSGGLAVDYDAGDFTEELVTGLHRVHPDALAIQVTRRHFGPAEEEFARTDTYRTYLVRPDDGEFLGGFAGDHQVLGGRDGVVVLYRSVPYPRVAVVRLGDSQE